MDKDFQDKIDEYVLGRMSAEERQEFEKEICRDDEKREQLRFTQNVKSAIDSRQEKLKRMEEMRRRHSISAATGTDDCRLDMRTFAPAPRKKPSLRRIWLWASGIAAVLVVGYFVINPLVVDNASMSNEIWRDDDEYIFEVDSAMIDDSVAKDTVFCDTTVVINDAKNSSL